jgi:hypothetical protein
MDQWRLAMVGSTLPPRIEGFQRGEEPLETVQVAPFWRTQGIAPKYIH